MRRVAFSGDRSDYSASLKTELEGNGITVREFASTGELEAALREGPDAVLMIGPPERGARNARAALDRAGGMITHLPLIAAFESAERLPGVETLRYFSDFLVAPAGLDELKARVELLLRRRLGEGNVLRAGDLLVNIDAHRVFLAGRPVDLTFKEFELLKTLAATPGRAYSREELLKGIWGYDYFGGTRTVDVHVRRLRSKIEAGSRFIETVHGVGYRFRK